jgi:cysteine desulfuration protein SufE
LFLSPPKPLWGFSLSSLQSMTIDELLAEFEFLGDWEDRCDYLIDMGLELPEMPSASKTEANRVHGCQSNVWMTIRLKPENGQQVVEITADSDAKIVKGLIAVLLTIYSNKTPEDILALDIRDLFDQLGLSRNSSPARKNGLNGMVQKIRSYAALALGLPDPENRKGEGENGRGGDLHSTC